MKKQLLLLMLTLLCSVMTWADEVTFTYSDYTGKGATSPGSEYTMEKNNVDITSTTFYGNNNQAHFYAGGKITVTPKNGATITKIAINCTAANYNGYENSGKYTPSTGTVAKNTNNASIVEWTGTASSAFTIDHDKQIRWSSIVVTYSFGGSSTDPDPSTDPTDEQNRTVSFSNLGYSSWGKSAAFSGTAYDEVSQVKDNVYFTYTRNEGSIYANSTAIRFYKSNELTFEAPEGFIITSIKFNASALKADVTTDVEECTSSTKELSWEGASESVTFTRPSDADSYITISGVTVKIAKGFDLTIGSSNWASMYLDFAAEVPEGATAYYAASVDKGMITLKSVEAGEVLPANTGVLVNGSSCTFKESTAEAADVTGNLFEGVTVATACEARTVWVLNTTSTAALGDPVLSLYTGTSLGANKAYLPASKVAGAKSLKLVFEDNTATGINAISNATANGVAYNLAGQRVAANAKGIVIVNGKKFINK